MASIINVPTPLRRYTHGLAEIHLTGETVAQLLSGLGSNYPELQKRLFNAANEGLNRFVHIYVNEEDIRFLNNLETPVQPTDRVSIILAVAGG